MAVSLVWQARLPFDGVLLTELSSSGTSVAIVVNQPNELQFNDQVLAIGGYSVDELVEHALRGETVVREYPDQPQQYLVRRGDQTVTLVVPMQRLPIGRLLLLRPGVYLLALASLLVGGYILLARPEEPSARVLVLVAINLGVPLVLHFQSAHLVNPALFLFENLLKALAMCLIFSGTLHLFLLFPVPKPWLRGRENWLLVLHGINPVLSAAIGAIAGKGLVGWLLVFWQSLYWIGLAMLCLAVVNLVHTYITVPQVTARSQIRWIVWGSVTGILPFIALTGIPEAISGRALLGIEVTSFFVIVVPITVAIAVARYRLFDIDTVIHRSLVYGLLMLLFTGVYLALVAALNAIVLELNRAIDPTTVVFVSALLAATAFWALRARLVRFLAPIFYRTRVDPAALLTEMSERLSRALHLDDISNLLTGAIATRLGATSGALMVLNEEGTRLESVQGDPFTLLLENVRAGWADHPGEPIRRSIPAPWVDPENLALMEQRGIELAIPLLAGHRLVGVWGLGPLRSGQPYTSEEVRTLATLSRQAAIAVENARLVRRMEQQNQELEETVRRRTQVLVEERNRLNAILQNMADGLLVTAEGGRIVLTNPALDAMLGETVANSSGRPADQVLPIPALATAIAEALTHPGQAQVHDLAADHRTFKASITALADRSAVVTLLRDITRETEVDRIKSAFISTVSHELRTPLTSILGFAKLIRRAVSRAMAVSPPQDEGIRQTLEQVDKNLDIIAQEGARLSSLISDALDMAALDSGEAKWQNAPTDILLLVRQAVSLIREELQEKGIALTIAVPDNLPRLVVDPRRIVQVIANLLSNAVKFTEHGEIAVTAQPLAAGTIVHGWQAPVGGAVLVIVRDTGIGIAASELDNIFQRFYQVSDMLCNKPKGTGLGLAICQEIVNHYAGILWVESTVGEGSTFYCALPVLE
jgi:signal transduction histidine kinase